MDEIILKNALRLVLGGYLYDTPMDGEQDEWVKLNNIPGILTTLAADYEKEIQDNQNMLLGE